MPAPRGTVMWIGLRVPHPYVLCKARETVDIFLPWMAQRFTAAI